MDKTTTSSVSAGESSTVENEVLLGISVHHLCTIFQPEVMVYVATTAAEKQSSTSSFFDSSEGITLQDITTTKVLDDLVVRRIMNNAHHHKNITTNDEVVEDDSDDDDSMNNKYTVSYVDTLQGKDHVGTVTHMISCSHEDTTLYDFTTSLIEFCEQHKHNAKRTYIWLDCLCTSRKTKDDIQELEDRMERHIPHVLVLLVPLYSCLPLYANQILCLYELYVALEQGIDITILVPTPKKEKLLKMIYQQTIKGYSNGILQDLMSSLTLPEMKEKRRTKSVFDDTDSSDEDDSDDEDEKTSDSNNNNNNYIQIELAESYHKEDKIAILRWINNGQFTNSGSYYYHINEMLNNYFQEEYMDKILVKETIHFANRRKAQLSSYFESGSGEDAIMVLSDMANMYNSLGLIYNNNDSMTNTFMANELDNTISNDNYYNPNNTKALIYFQKSQQLQDRIRALNYYHIGSEILKNKKPKSERKKGERKTRYYEAKGYFEKAVDTASIASSSIHHNLYLKKKTKTEYDSDDDDDDSHDGIADKITDNNIDILAKSYNTLSHIHYKLKDYNLSLNYAQHCYTNLSQLYGHDPREDEKENEEDAHMLLAAAQKLRESMITETTTKHINAVNVYQHEMEAVKEEEAETETDINSAYYHFNNDTTSSLMMNSRDLAIQSHYDDMKEENESNALVLDNSHYDYNDADTVAITNALLNSSSQYYSGLGNNDTTIDTSTEENEMNEISAMIHDPNNNVDDDDDDDMEIDYEVPEQNDDDDQAKALIDLVNNQLKLATAGDYTDDTDKELGGGLEQPSSPILELNPDQPILELNTGDKTKTKQSTNNNKNKKKQQLKNRRNKKNNNKSKQKKKQQQNNKNKK